MNLSNKLLTNKIKSKDRSTLGWAIKIIVCLIFLFYAITLIYPFVWMSINALKTKEEFYRNVFALPESWKFSNYYDAIVKFKITVGSGANTRYVNLLQMFGMSIFLTATVTVLEILVSSELLCQQNIS